MHNKELLEKIVEICGFSAHEREEIVEDLEDEIVEDFITAFADNKEATPLVSGLSLAFESDDTEKISNMLDQLAQKPDLQARFSNTFQDVVADWFATITEGLTSQQQEDATQKISELGS